MMSDNPSHAVNTTACCVWISTWVLNNFFLYINPLTDGRGSGFKLRVPPVGPPYGPLLMRTQPFLRWIGCFMALENFAKFDFFRNPSFGPGMGLGDHLVTIRVL